jgi:acyl-CoA synthetase (AMP-forming)/AMP-acid ligase II
MGSDLGLDVRVGTLASGAPTSVFVFDWLNEHAEARPDAPAIGTTSGWLTYRDLRERVFALAAHLAARGVGPDTRVPIALPNLPATVVATLAVQALGGTSVELNRESGLEAISAIVGEVEARHAIILGRDAEMWGELVRRHALEHVCVVYAASALPSRITAPLAGAECSVIAEDGELPVVGGSFRPVRRPDAAACIVYTSGSTGKPRGVIQTHRNIAANTRSIVEYLGLGPEDRAMNILPLFYCYGKSVLQTHLYVGGSVFFDHRFTYPRVVMEAMAAEGCTGFYGVPLTYELLRRQMDPREVPLRALRYLAVAGGAMHPETIAWARQAFAPARLYVMYGQTEATARLSYLPPERAADKAGSIGRGIPGVELKVMDEGGRELPAGQTGEVWARGENVTPGYYRDPMATAQILSDGWLRTGDLGAADEDGFIFLTGRAKQILKIGGHRVSPVEIEQALAAHPDVLETAVVGMGDPLGGEAAAAFVVLRTGSSVTELELRKYCRETMPAWKVPKGMLFLPALPRTGAGKVATSELAQILAATPPRPPDA